MRKREIIKILAQGKRKMEALAKTRDFVYEETLKSIGVEDDTALFEYMYNQYGRADEAWQRSARQKPRKTTQRLDTQQK